MSDRCPLDYLFNLVVVFFVCVCVFFFFFFSNHPFIGIDSDTSFRAI